MSQPDQPIIIAGAGPCGSTLALYLAQRDIPVLLLEAEDALPRDLRASTFHPPTLEMLDGLGIADDMLDIGLVANRYQYRDRRSGEVAEFDMDLIADETAFPFRLQLEQYEMTHIAARHLQRYPHAEQRFGHRVLGAEQQGDTVRRGETRDPTRRIGHVHGGHGRKDATILRRLRQSLHDGQTPIVFRVTSILGDVHLGKQDIELTRVRHQFERFREDHFCFVDHPRVQWVGRV